VIAMLRSDASSGTSEVAAGCFAAGRLVTLINPPSPTETFGTSLFSIPPIGLTYVAAALERAGYTVDIVDGVGEWIEEDATLEIGGRTVALLGGSLEAVVARIQPETVLVGITCMFMHHWPVVRTLVERIQAHLPGVPVVLGGEHASGGARYCLQESAVDAIVRGEGDETIVPLTEALLSGGSLRSIAGIAFKDADGSICVTPPRARIRDVGSIARPAWHLVRVADYMRKARFHGPSNGSSMPILATRGCPYQCTFCTSPGMWTTQWIARDPEDVVDEMSSYREAYGARDFQFVDLTAIVKKDWILAFCDALSARGWTDITWQLPSGTRSEAIDEEVASRLVATGCKLLTYAPESGSLAVLKRIKKKVNLDRMKQSIRDARRAGARVECFLMIGFPDETLREILQTYRFILQLVWIGVHSIGYSGYRPVPGTEISDRLVAEGRLHYGDDVYLSLMKSTSFFQSVSWSRRFSNLQLSLLRVFGLALFYGGRFLSRPWVLPILVHNVLVRRQSTKLDRVLIDLTDALRGPRQRLPARR